MKRFILCIALLTIAVGCSSTRVRGDYKTPKGTSYRTFTPAKSGTYEQVERKLAGMTVYKNVNRVKTRAEQADDKVVNVLYIVALASALGVAFALVCCYLEKAGRFPCPWWDETLMVCGAGLGLSLIGLWLYVWLKWAIILSALGYFVYRGAKWSAKHAKEKSNGN